MVFLLFLNLDQNWWTIWTINHLKLARLHPRVDYNHWSPYCASHFLYNFLQMQLSSWSSTAIPVVSISIILIIIFIFFRKYLTSKTTSNQPGLPPGPTPLPFIGCTVQMLLNRPTFRWIHKLMDQFNTPILCIKLKPSTHVIAVSSPNLACKFLRKQDVVFSSRPETL